jgi:hypothetical protein
MKTAIYIENGRSQIVLTPENDWEKQVIKGIADKPSTVRFHNGSFYPCQGGYTRHGTYDESLIIVTHPKIKEWIP